MPEFVNAEHRTDNRIGGRDPRRVHSERLLELMDQPGTDVVDESVGYLRGDDLAGQAMPTHTLRAASANQIRKVVGEDAGEDAAVGYIGGEQLLAYGILLMRQQHCDLGAGETAARLGAGCELLPGRQHRAAPV